MKRFELYEKRDTLSMELSRGMRQKLAISSGYLHDPALILLDEPLTGLDPMGIRVMKESIRERAQAGAALMVSSHLLTLVEDLCTHVLIMAKGTQKFFGTLEEARDAFSTDGEGSLEDVFFSATQEPESPASPGPGAITGTRP
ncbi:MAG: ATP-binding cassette domain-containing protein [Planctomycetota bacterium]